LAKSRILCGVRDTEDGCTGKKLELKLKIFEVKQST